MDGAVSSQTRPRALVAAVVVVALEAALAAALAVILVVELLIAPAASLASGIALAVLAVLAAAWVIAIALGLWRMRPWTRAAAIVWQVLQAGVGLGALQGAFAAPAWGWPLIGASVVGLVLLLRRSVGDALGSEDRGR